MFGKGRSREQVQDFCAKLSNIAEAAALQAVHPKATASQEPKQKRQTIHNIAGSETLAKLAALEQERKKQANQVQPRARKVEGFRSTITPPSFSWTRTSSRSESLPPTYSQPRHLRRRISRGQHPCPSRHSPPFSAHRHRTHTLLYVRTTRPLPAVRADSLAHCSRCRHRRTWSASSRTRTLQARRPSSSPRSPEAARTSTTYAALSTTRHSARAGLRYRLYDHTHRGLAAHHARNECLGFPRRRFADRILRVPAHFYIFGDTSRPRAPVAAHFLSFVAPSYRPAAPPASPAAPMETDNPERARHSDAEPAAAAPPAPTGAASADPPHYEMTPASVIAVGSVSATLYADSRRI